MSKETKTVDINALTLLICEGAGLYFCMPGSQRVDDRFIDWFITETHDRMKSYEEVYFETPEEVRDAFANSMSFHKITDLAVPVTRTSSQVESLTKEIAAYRERASAYLANFAYAHARYGIEDAGAVTGNMFLAQNIKESLDNNVESIGETMERIYNDIAYYDDDLNFVVYYEYAPQISIRD